MSKENPVTAIHSPQPHSQPHSQPHPSTLPPPPSPTPIQVDPAQIIQHLINRIGELEYRNALLQAALDGQRPVAVTPTPTEKE